MLTFTYLMETTISDWLASTLKETGMSQAELARKSGVSAAHITKVLNGERGLGETSLRAIAEALGVPPEIAFRVAGFLPPVSADTEQKERLLYVFDRLSDRNRENLLMIASALLDQEKQ